MVGVVRSERGESLLGCNQPPFTEPPPPLRQASALAHDQQLLLVPKVKGQPSLDDETLQKPLSDTGGCSCSSGCSCRTSEKQSSASPLAARQSQLGQKMAAAGGVPAEPSEGPKPIAAAPKQEVASSCDACIGCADVCGVKGCRTCQMKMQQPGVKKHAELNKFTMCQVRRHNTRGDCWLVAHGKVYDATNFMGRHPAGVEPILKRAGADATVDYDFHSNKARKKTWAPLLLGKVARCPIKDPPAKKQACSVM